MEPVQSNAQVGRITPMIGGTPRQWAITTTDQIVEAASDASPDAVQKIGLLKQRIAAALMVPFMKTRTPQTPESLLSMAEDATVAVTAVALGTPWSMNFSEPTIRQAIKDKIAQNLSSAAGA